MGVLYHFCLSYKMNFYVFEESTRQCSIPSSTHNICSFIQKQCDTNYFKISELYYCYLTSSLPSLLLSSLLILVLLVVILISLSILVSNYLFQNLHNLTNVLGLNNQILSFILIPLTNSLPDILNYYIALDSGSTDLVIGQLMGSLLIMFTVIIGSISILNRGYIIDHPKILMLDLVIVLIVLILFLEILSDGKITNLECWTMITGYFLYILFLIFFDKDKLKESADEEQIWIEYLNNGLFTHPYNIEDAISILSSNDDEIASYGPVFSRSPSPLPDNTNSPNGSLSLSISSLSPRSSSPLCGPTELVTEESPLLLSVPGKFSTSESSPSISVNEDSEDEIIIQIPSRSKSFVQRAFDLVDCLFLTFVPYYRKIESNYSKTIICWYIMETTAIINYQFFQIPYKYVIPLSYIVAAILVHVQVSNNVQIVSISVAGLTVSLIIVSNLAIITLQLLKNLGVIWQISDYLLGLIVFAISNSLNDGITNVTISTKINPILGINSCIGTPLLIILLGIGGSGLIVTSRSHKDILFNLTDNVVISAAGLIFSICCLIIYLPWNNYRVDAKIGNFLLLLYIVMTGVEICLEY